MPEAKITYQAFISYRHADNLHSGRQWATWLHQAIETYEVPDELVGKLNRLGQPIPERIFPVFRDEEALPANADLGNSITHALDHSNLLVVLCSPNANASTYVADEIDYFKRQGNSDRIIAAIIDGEPNASWDTSKHNEFISAQSECFPTPLRFKYDTNGVPSDVRAEPIAADFRVTINGQQQQGFTNPQALKEYLEKTSELSRQSIAEISQGYQKQLDLMKLKIIAGILCVPLDELTQRDKAYQLAKEQARNRSLRRWFSIVAVLTLIAVVGVLGALQFRHAAEQTEIVNGLLERAKNLDSARYFANNQQYQAALQSITKLVYQQDPAEHDYSQIASFLLQSYQTEADLPSDVLTEEQLYTFKGQTILYRNGEKLELAQGTPSLAIVDSCTEQILIGYDNNRTTSLQVFDTNSLSLLHNIEWQEWVVFDGRPLRLGKDSLLFPVYEPGSYVGANVSALYYLDLSDTAPPIMIEWGNNSFFFDIETNTLTLLGIDQLALFQSLASEPSARFTLNTDHADNRLKIQFHDVHDPYCGATITQRKDMSVSKFPLPTRKSEPELWQSDVSSAFYDNAGDSIPDKLVIDRATGALYQYLEFADENTISEFIDMGFLDKVLASHDDRLFLMRIWNYGSHGNDYLACQFSLRPGVVIPPQQFVDTSVIDRATPPDCRELDGLMAYEDYLLQHPFSRYIPFKNGHFTEGLLTLVDTHTSETYVIHTEVGAVNSWYFEQVAVLNEPLEILAVADGSLLRYTKPNSSLVLQNQVSLNIDPSDQVIALQMSAKKQAIMLLASGRMVSIDPANGLLNWQINVGKIKNKGFMIGSRNQSLIGVVIDQNFLLLDAGTGIQLSEPFDYIASAVSQFGPIEAQNNVAEYFIIEPSGSVDIGIYTAEYAEREVDFGGELINRYGADIALRRLKRQAPTRIPAERINSELAERGLENSSRR